MDYFPWSKAVLRIGEFRQMPGPAVLFIAFDSQAQLQAILRECSDCAIIKASDYCREDSDMDLDEFAWSLRNAKDKNLILGLGEYLALTGHEQPLRICWSAKSKRFIAPVWNGYEFLASLMEWEPYRSMGSPAICLEKSHASWRFKRFLVPADVDCKGLKAILSRLETGYSGELSVSTAVPFITEWGRVIGTYAEKYMDSHPGVKVPPDALSDDVWRALAEGEPIADDSFFGPVSFLSLKTHGSENSYLNLVLAKTGNQAQFRTNFVDLFLECKRSEPEFAAMAAARRQLLPELDMDDIGEFILKLKRLPQSERIFYLTDSSAQEKEEIIKCIKEDPHLPPGLYEDLAAYMEDYQFGEDETGRQLSSYFNAYKEAKLRNRITDEVLELGRKNGNLIFMLPTRGKLMDTFADNRTKLYWLDSLGCEYLAFIHKIAAKKHIRMRAWAAQAILPSITSLNRDFYDAWPGDKEAEKALDNLKHGKEGTAGGENARAWPLHLPRELEIIEQVVGKIAGDLKSGKYARVILGSDHGATRLAVLSNEEQQWDMPEKGRFGGRCCPYSSDVIFKPASAVRSDDQKWLVLKDYSRFRGSHQPSVEVHGGASIEETVIPVIEFALQKKLPTITQILPGDEARPSVKDKYITIMVLADMPLEKAQLRMNSKNYPVRESGEKGQYVAEIPVNEARAENEGRIVSDNMELDAPVKFRLIRGMRQQNFDDLFD